MLVKIIQLLPDDWELFRDIRLEALQEDPSAFAGTYAEDIKTKEELWRDRIKNMWFAVVDSQVVGMAGLLRDTGLASNHRAHLISCYVKPLFRSRGIGRDLVKHVQEYAVTQGIRKIYLHVTSLQEKAIKLYECLGFNKVGLLKEYTKINGQYFDSYIMEWRVRKLEN
jgi:ribosomal protein S18 acetylase RimI-like enzyme